MRTAETAAAKDIDMMVFLFVVVAMVFNINRGKTSERTKLTR